MLLSIHSQNGINSNGTLLPSTHSLRSSRLSFPRARGTLVSITSHCSGNEPALLTGLDRAMEIDPGST